MLDDQRIEWWSKFERGAGTSALVLLFPVPVFLGIENIMMFLFRGLGVPRVPYETNYLLCALISLGFIVLSVILGRNGAGVPKIRSFLYILYSILYLSLSIPLFGFDDEQAGGIMGYVFLLGLFIMGVLLIVSLGRNPKTRSYGVIIAGLAVLLALLLILA